VFQIRIRPDLLLFCLKDPYLDPKSIPDFF